MQALSWALEVVPFGVNKAVAAKALLDRWGIAPQNAAAIGDGACGLWARLIPTQQSSHANVIFLMAVIIA